MFCADYTLIHGDCLEELKKLPDNSVDSLVTDPPAGILFMGLEFDSDKGGRDHWIKWLKEVMQECIRVMKPGAHGLVWAIPRTSHWTATALEDAGFRIKDCLQHLFGSGFPKSHSCKNIGRPELGSALKPSAEFWWLVQKPLEKGLTIDKNVQKWNVGALEIDKSRVKIEGHYGPIGKQSPNQPPVTSVGWGNGYLSEKSEQGRWPAHTVFSHNPDCVEVGTAFECTDGCPIAELDRQSGVSKSNVRPPTGKDSRGTPNVNNIVMRINDSEERGHTDSGGASRFFQTFDAPFLYTAKASKREKNAGLDSVEIINISCGPWESADLKVQLQVDTEQSVPKAIAASGTWNNNASEWNTLLFGNSTSDPLKENSKSTTRTKTNSIIESKTLNWLVHLFTSANILDANSLTVSGGNLVQLANSSSTSQSIIKDLMDFATNAKCVLENVQLEIKSSGQLVNGHPTVKSSKLMSYLITMITPPGGTCLDCFLGSGSTGVAAIQNGFKFIGIEREKEYIQIAEKRIYHAFPKQEKQYQTDDERQMEIPGCQK